MLDQINFEKVLFIDIETVPMAPSYDDLPGIYKKLWDRKAEFLRKGPEDTPGVLFERAGIFAEFGKIICISTGYLLKDALRIKSFSGDEEKVLLEEFALLLNQYFNRPDNYLCAHNGKEFDFPYIARRMLINRIILPEVLDMQGKKPWEVKHLDTMELWRFGDYKSYTSLELLATLFDIPTPKDDISGADICRVYYEEKNLPRIVEYCQKDVITIVQLILRYLNKPILDSRQIHFA